FECDEDRGTCTWDTSNPTCNGEVSCERLPPSCPVGQVPAIDDGCYTGSCIAISACEAAPACEALQHEGDCLRGSNCEAVYSGESCTCNGVPCSCSDDPGSCICEVYVYQGCETVD